MQVILHTVFEGLWVRIQDLQLVNPASAGDALDEDAWFAEETSDVQVQRRFREERASFLKEKDRISDAWWRDLMRYPVHMQDAVYAYEDTPFRLELMLDHTAKRVSFIDLGAYFLRTNSAVYVFLDGKLSLLDSPLRFDKLCELIDKQSLQLPDKVFVRLLQQSSLDLFGTMGMPDVVQLTDGWVVLDFRHTSEHYEILASVHFGKRGNLPLLFEELQGFISEGTAMVLRGFDTVYMVDPETRLFHTIERLVALAFDNFSAFFNEIEGNRIRTKDRENLFHSFLAEAQEFVEVNVQGEEVAVLQGDFDQKEMEILPSEQTGYGIDWLEVRFHFSMQDTPIDFAGIQSLMRDGFLLQKRKLISISEKEQELLDQLFSKVQARYEDGVMLLRKERLSELSENQVDLHFPDYLRYLVVETAHIEIELPDYLNNVLRLYQKEAVYWIYFLFHNGFGGVLADEMGLGKTLEVLSFLYVQKQEGCSLILCPSSLLYNWASEIDKFFDGKLTYLVVDGSKEERLRKIEQAPQYDILITSFHLYYLDVDAYDQQDFFYCVLDEAQHIKNKKAKRTHAIKQNTSRYRLALTGTPVENNVTELWSIFDFLMPGLLGSYGWFRQRFEQAIHSFESSKRDLAMRDLKRLIRPFILRRTKEMVSPELPAKIEQTILLELSDTQKAFYVDTLSRVRHELFDVKDGNQADPVYIQFLSALTRLRQICLHPSLVYPDLEDDLDLSVKLHALKELLLDAMDSGHRVLVFSQFTSMLQIIRQYLTGEQIEYLYLDGSTRHRVDLVKLFNESEIPIFLISLRAGGTGLNLTGADSVIIFDPWWNPSVEYQAIDRAHRIGQQRTVHVYRLLTRGTIEEKIHQLQQHKREIFDRMLSQQEQVLQYMTFDEIRALFEE